MRNPFFHKKVLITGANGFIGSHLTEYLLQQGAHVVAVVIDALACPDDRAENPLLLRYTCDIGNATRFSEIVRVESPDYIFHLAGNANVPRSVASPQFDFTLNATNTVNVLEAVRLHAPKAVMILASTSAVYGEPGIEPITEETRKLPISPYGASKWCAEEMCSIYHKTFGLNVVIARLFNCYGPRMGKFVIPDFIKKLSSAPDVLEILGDGRQTRDFTYIEDVIHGLCICASNGIPGEAYNLSSGSSHTVTELATILINLMNLDNTTKINYTGSSWKGDAQFWKVDISKARQIGYQPKFSLTHGLKKLLEWQGEQLQKQVEVIPLADTNNTPSTTTTDIKHDQTTKSEELL